MIRNGVVGLLAVFLAAFTVLGSAVEMRGAIGASIELLPTLAGSSLLNITASGEAWTFSSDTSISFFPAFGVQETLSFVYTTGPAELTAQASMALSPWAFNSGKLMATLDLFKAELRDDAPQVSLDASFSGGVDLNEDLSPFAQFTARALMDVAEHSLRFTTTLSLLPLGVASQLVANLSLGNISLISTTSLSFAPFGITSTLLGRISFEDGALDDAQDGAVTVSAYAELLQSIVPLSFSYARVSGTVTAEPYSLEGSVTYYGEAAFHVGVVAAAQLEHLKLEAWASYSSTAETSVGVGVGATLAVGPIALSGAED